MDNVIVGIDVSKDRLDVALRPSGEAFVVERNAAGLEMLSPHAGRGSADSVRGEERAHLGARPYHSNALSTGTR